MKVRRPVWMGLVLAIGLSAGALPALAERPASSASRSLPTLSTSPVTLPTVTTPPVTVGPVTVPTATTPTLTAPTVSAPSLPTPTPTPSTPTVPTPTVPAPSVKPPTVATPPPVSSPHVGAPGAPAASTAAPTASGASQPASNSEASRAAADPGTSVGSGALASQNAGRTASRSPAVVHGAGGPHGDRGGVAETVQRDQQLRQDVLRLRGCLAFVPRGERRVIALRAGVGVDHPRSRRAVAQLTGMRTGRVVRLERRGLRRLRALGRDRRCAPAAAPASSAAPADPSGPPAAARPHAGQRSAVLAERQSSASRGGQPPAKEAASRQPVLHALGSIAGGRALDLTIALVGLALLGFAAVALYDFRRT